MIRLKSDYIVALRKNILGLTRRQFCDRSGMLGYRTPEGEPLLKVPTLRAIEMGRGDDMMLRHAVIIARTAGVGVDALFEDRPEAVAV